MLLAYSDEAATAAKSVTFMSELIGVGGIATVGLFGVLASVLNLQKTPEVNNGCVHLRACKSVEQIHRITPFARIVLLST